MGAFAQIGRMVLDGAMDLLFPPRCALCKAESPETICKDCRALMELLSPPFCRKCGLTAPGSIARCINCRRYYTFDSARSAGWHEGGLRHAIHLLKYQDRRALAKPLARILADSPAAEGLYAEAIVPVPLHPSRLRERGFNQAELVARELGAILGLPVITRAIARRSAGPPQVGRTADERLLAVRGVFEVRRPELIEKKNLIVLDDVFTTGSTLSEVATTLKSAGSGRVTAVTLSRDR